ncbi:MULTISPECIES: chemotaxis protein [Helicobacter]|uniref:chemotaxis protein n=1 Tax=Helicobacter TaxID=209 RepID=UPI000DCAF210|nr:MULTISPECIES: chemotaxis protein [Helicobacter]MCI2236421.1 chemotaxis protein [Helicobacter sp. CaF467b]MCL9821780.1 chemotaxis protein [Helicobacter colisuis]MDY4427138.1 chemotaxis protein [Helicobacter sp.]MDY5615578.1 chemotaxis protein [Helicobacter sp.]RAX52007.1 chemotaxis protein [Helicobacter sp. 11-8110]
MTQEELDALLNESVLDTMEDGSANKEEKAENSSEKEAEIKTAEGIKTEGFHIDSETSWPPPPPTTEHKVVHQLDDVTRDSEVKATETFDKLELINNAGMDIEEGLGKIDKFVKSQEAMLQKLHQKFPDFHTFSQQLEEVVEVKSVLETLLNASQDISNASLEAMDIMQYQDIHRQKIERVINVMRALSRYMSSLFEGKVDDAKRVSSAVHIQGDNTENVVNEEDIEALIANFGK